MMRAATANIVMPMITATAMENLRPSVSLFVLITPYPFPQAVEVPVVCGFEGGYLGRGQDSLVPELQEAFFHGLDGLRAGGPRRRKGPVRDVRGPCNDLDLAEVYLLFEHIERRFPHEARIHVLPVDAQDHLFLPFSFHEPEFPEYVDALFVQEQLLGEKTAGGLVRDDDDALSPKVSGGRDRALPAGDDDAAEDVARGLEDGVRKGGGVSLVGELNVDVGVGVGELNAPAPHGVEKILEVPGDDELEFIARPLRKVTHERVEPVEERDGGIERQDRDLDGVPAVFEVVLARQVLDHDADHIEVALLRGGESVDVLHGRDERRIPSL